MSNAILEFFTHSTTSQDIDWASVVKEQSCAYIGRRCIKNRKSQPEISMGTCAVQYSVQAKSAIICPHRFLERGQIFFDCLHLLNLHEPGNELHRITDVEVPGGSVNYFLVSVRQDKVVDFVGIEFQALDTTGSLWPTRQEFLASQALIVNESAGSPVYGINWKMTAKTTLLQLHQKVESFEGLGKHLVLVLQDNLLDYMRREFHFEHIQDAKLGHAMHFHAYSLQPSETKYRLQLASRSSTNADGIASALGLQANANVELDVIVNRIQSKLSSQTLLKF